MTDEAGRPFCFHGGMWGQEEIKTTPRRERTHLKEGAAIFALLVFLLVLLS